MTADIEIIEQLGRQFELRLVRFDGVDDITWVSDELHYALDTHGKVSILRMSDSMMYRIPKDVYKLSNLKILEIVYSRIAVLSPSITKLSKLKHLAVTDFEHKGRLTSIPPEIRVLKRLKSLSLYGNQISILPSEITQLTNLERIDIHANPIKIPPPEIAKRQGA